MYKFFSILAIFTATVTIFSNTSFAQNSFGIGSFNNYGIDIVGKWCFSGSVQSAATDGCMTFNSNNTGSQTFCVTSSNVGKSCTSSLQYFSWNLSNGQLTLTFDAQNILTYSISNKDNFITMLRGNEIRNLVKGDCQATFHVCGNCGGTGKICIPTPTWGCLYHTCSNCLGSGKLIVHNCH
ncbi:MAG: hypothetical protein J0L99_14805 [Chitinophagales bacterium]|nr:hypothetical protein [Chitinophagales bacterium]